MIYKLFLVTKKPWLGWSIGLLLFAAVAVFDFATGTEIASSIFYLIPIVYLSRYGKTHGMLAVALGGILWFLSDVLSGHDYSHPAVLYWNALVRFGIFATVSILFVRLQAELNSLRFANKEIERLASIKSEFVSTVSHELRTPLTAIKENLTIVQDGSVGPLTTEQKDFLGAVKRNIERLAALINDVLDLQRLESGVMSYHFKKEDLNQLVNDMASNYTALAAKKGITFRCILGRDLPPVEIDRERMGQVLSNLIQNALNYSDHGVITIRTQSLGRGVSFLVEDQGRGIAANEIPKLFQPFQRLSSSLDAQASGTGLGLVISRRIVDAHHGKIEVMSVDGQGSTFCVTLKPFLDKEHPNG